MSEARECAAQKQADKQRTQEKKQKERLATLQNAVPFKSGLKWGLKSGERIIVPPIYRRIQKPIGNYCAMEENPNRWGYHHVGRESRGRSPIYERGNKRQRDGLPDYHTGKDKDRKAINRSAGKYAPNKIILSQTKNRLAENDFLFFTFAY